jgi:hypothetical protein
MRLCSAAREAVFAEASSDALMEAFGEGLARVSLEDSDAFSCNLPDFLWLTGAAGPGEKKLRVYQKKFSIF